MFVAEFRENVRITIPVIAKCLNDFNWDVRKAAIEFLSMLAAHSMCLCHFVVGVLKHVVGEFSGDVRITIPVIAKHLRHFRVYEAAIEGLSMLAAQGMC